MVYKTKPQNRRHVVLPDSPSRKYPPHGVEEMQEGQSGTTIYDDDLKDRDKSRTESALSSTQTSSIISRTH